jgi:DNA polymerase III subunit delta'
MTLFGHHTQMTAFRAAVAGDRLHHAWLLAGPRGIGKRRFADAVLSLLLPGQADAPLIAAGTHPDIIRLERLENEKTGVLARSITVDQVRAMRDRMTTATGLGGRRVIIIDAADELEGQGGPNALLKTLEEPPASTIFLLIAHAPGRLLPTIRSRCRTLAFSPLGDAAMAELLAVYAPGADPLPLIAQAGGIPANALSAAGLAFDEIESFLERLSVAGDPSNAIGTTLAHMLSTKAALPRYEAFLRRVPQFLAVQAKRADGPRRGRAIAAWEAASALSAIAQPRSLVAESVVFALSGHVATLAGGDPGAKA